MELITKEYVLDFIKNNRIELQSAQNKLCLPIISRIYRKMVYGIKFSGISVAGNIIVDGHHRYIASLLASFHLERNPSSTTSATAITEWLSVDFVEEDWDTVAKIKWLNERDATYNNIALETIEELLK